MNFLSYPRWMQPAPDSAVAENIRRGKAPFTDAIHLLWSAWIFVTPLFGGGFTLSWLYLTLLSYPLFLVLFAMTLLSPRRTAYRYPLGMALLCFALLGQYPSGISYFVYACVMLRPGNMRFTVSMLFLLGLNLAFVGCVWLIGYPWQMMVYIPATTLIISVIVNVEHLSQEKDAALKLSHDEVRRLAATAERERIGRDLHDLLGHTLSLITLKLELSRKLQDRDSEAARREVAEAEGVARQALAEVRAAVTGIRATDLAAELASARLLLASSGVYLDYQLAALGLPETVERSLALVIREASTNIVRHARATEAKVTLGTEGSMVLLQIGDNGRGGVGEEGNGLCGMRERVRGIGGVLEIESSAGRGTCLRVRVPLPSTLPHAAFREGVAASAAALDDAGRSAA